LSATLAAGLLPCAATTHDGQPATIATPRDGRAGLLRRPIGNDNVAMLFALTTFDWVLIALIAIMLLPNSFRRGPPKPPPVHPNYNPYES
jgi:hypothetical protein